ncbi:MAG: M48 family metalloprotease [Planctomycetes bacterium]|nr:M48 family metalloprotease [Planctomycetota bacterium]
MIRPISLFLLLLLIVGNREAAQNVQPNSYWLLFLLCVCPAVAVLIAIIASNTKTSQLLSTIVILISWCIAIYSFQWTSVVRNLTQDVVIVDEALILIPPIFWLCILWWCTSPITNRTSWVSYRLRLDILLLFVPVFFLLVISEVSSKYGTPKEYIELIELAALVALLGLAPFLIAKILPAKEIQNYELRSSIGEVGRRAGVHRSNVLVWNTHGRIMNALAIGIILQPKTIVLTDKLIANLTPTELLAVITHEFGHHKYWHIPFLILTAVTTLICSSRIFMFMGFDMSSEFIFMAELVVMTAAIVFVSKQFERQADAYTAIDMSKMENSDCITTNAAQAMSQALGTIAESQHIALDRNDPLHGSIQKRQEYLHALVGYKLAEIPINTKVKWIKITILVSLFLGIVL